MKMRRPRTGKYAAIVRLHVSGFLACPPWRRLRLRVRGRFLICGASGVGKSSVGETLAACGFHVVEADERLGRFMDPLSEDPVDPPPGREPEWYERHPWHWGFEEVDALLKAPVQEHLFLCGGADNESEFYRRFDTVYFLQASESVLEDRLAGRAGDTHTAHPAWIAHTINGHRRRAARAAREERVVVIDADRPLFRVARDILRHAASRGASPRRS